MSMYGIPPSHEAAKADTEHRRKQAGPSNLMYDIQWVWHVLTFPVRALVSWRKSRKGQTNPWAPDRQRPS